MMARSQIFVLGFVTICLFLGQCTCLTTIRNSGAEVPTPLQVLLRLKRTPVDFQPNRQRPLSYAPGMDTAINMNGRNILVPNSSKNALIEGPRLVTVLRTESNANQRIGPNGIIPQTDRRGQQSTAWVGVHSDPQRTEEFMQQSRARETKALRENTRDRKALLTKMNGVTDEQLNRLPLGQQQKFQDSRAYMQNTDLRPLEFSGFSANEQTIKRTEIPASVARNIILSSTKEGDAKKPLSSNDQALGLSRDVKNTDITKSYNQFGVKGDALNQLSKAVGTQPITTGTTYENKRRSSPPALKKFSLAPRKPEPPKTVTLYKGPQLRTETPRGITQPGRGSNKQQASFTGQRNQGSGNRRGFKKG